MEKDSIFQLLFRVSVDFQWKKNQPFNLNFNIYFQFKINI